MTKPGQAGTQAPDLHPVTYLEEEWIRAVDGRASDHNVPLAITIRGPLDRGLLSTALQALTARQETLRTAFVLGSSVLGSSVLGSSGTKRAVWPATEHHLPVVDLANADERSRDRQLSEMILDQARRPTDLTRSPLWRGSLVRMAPACHVLITTWHHAIFDGWSSRVAMRDLARLYTSAASGGQPHLPELEIQMADYAAWERQLTLPATAAAYWRGVLPSEPAALPVDKDTASQPQVIAGRPFPPIPADQVSRLEEIARGQRATLASALRAIVLMALRPYLPERPAVGLVYANRERPELQPVIGLLSDHLLMTPDLSGTLSFPVLVSRVHSSVRAARAHQAPLGAIINALPHLPARDQMFDVSINNMRYGRPAAETATAPCGSPVMFSVRDVPAAELWPRIKHAFTGGFRLGYQLRLNAVGELTGEVWGHLSAFRIATLDMLGRTLAETAGKAASDPQRTISAG